VGLHDIEGDIERDGGVREAADTDAIDAGGGQGRERFESYTTRGFELEGGVHRVAAGGGSVEKVGAHVIEEHDVDGSGREGQEGFKLRERIDFDLDEGGWMASGSAQGAGAGRRGSDNGGESGEGGAGDVIVFDEDGVVEADAVTEAAAAADGVFLEDAEAGGGFAGVEEAGPGCGGDAGDELGGAGGDAGETADEIEEGAFEGEEFIERALDDSDGGERRDGGAIGDECGYAAAGREEAGGFIGDGEAGNNAAFAGDEMGAGHAGGRDAALGGDVADGLAVALVVERLGVWAEVFLEGECEKTGDEAGGRECRVEVWEGERVEVGMRHRARVRWGEAMGTRRDEEEPEGIERREHRERNAEAQEEEKRSGRRREAGEETDGRRDEREKRRTGEETNGRPDSEGHRERVGGIGGDSEVSEDFGGEGDGKER